MRRNLAIVAVGAVGLLVFVGSLLMFSLSQFFLVSAEEFTPKPKTLILVTPTPSLPYTSEELASSISSDGILVMSPRPGENVGSSLIVEGTAKVSANTLNIRVKESTGQVLAEAVISPDSPYGQESFFAEEVFYPTPLKQDGIVEVYERSTQNGEEVNKVVIPIKFSDLEPPKLASL